MEPIPYGRHCIDDDDIAAVTTALKSDAITQGPLVKEFEDHLATMHGCKYAVVFSNGTAALHGAYYAAGIGPGDEFIVPAITFVASANGGVYQGASPVLCDIDRETYNIDIDKINDLITDRTRVITPVSYAGNPVDVKRIAELARKKGLVIIHDAAHAIGARLNGDGVADYADMTMLSFHPVKHVTTAEGGAILTNDSGMYKKLLLFRTHGITKAPEELSVCEGPWYYEMQDLGYNYRITDIQCALGISQLKKLESSILTRNRIARIYDVEFGDLDWLQAPRNIYDGASVHAYHLYPILLDKGIDRLDFFNYMRHNQILVQVHYIPINYMPYYQKRFGYARGMYPVAEDFYAREISLPMYPTLTSDQQEYVIKTVMKYGDRLI